jgi:hypothetical protein
MILARFGPNSPIILDRSSADGWMKLCLLCIKGSPNPIPLSPPPLSLLPPPLPLSHPTPSPSLFYRSTAPSPFRSPSPPSMPPRPATYPDDAGTSSPHRQWLPSCLPSALLLAFPASTVGRAHCSPELHGGGRGGGGGGGATEVVGAGALGGRREGGGGGGGGGGCCGGPGRFWYPPTLRVPSTSPSPAAP